MPTDRATPLTLPSRSQLTEQQRRQKCPIQPSPTKTPRPPSASYHRWHHAQALPASEPLLLTSLTSSPLSHLSNQPIGDNPTSSSKTRYTPSKRAVQPGEIGTIQAPIVKSVVRLKNNATQKPGGKPTRKYLTPKPTYVVPSMQP